MDINNLFEEAVLNWRNNKGIGTAFVPNILNDKVLVYQILARFYARSPTNTTIIIVNDFQERTKIIEFLTNNEQSDNNEEFKNLISNKFIKVLTSDFFIKNWNTAVNLCIWYRPKEYNDNILNFISNCRFKLIVLNNLIINSKEASNIYKKAPIL